MTLLHTKSQDVFAQQCGAALIISLMCLYFMQNEILDLKSQQKFADDKSNTSLKEMEVRSCPGRASLARGLPPGSTLCTVWARFWALGCRLHGLAMHWDLSAWALAEELFHCQCCSL